MQEQGRSTENTAHPISEEDTRVNTCNPKHGAESPGSMATRSDLNEMPTCRCRSIQMRQTYEASTKRLGELALCVQKSLELERNISLQRGIATNMVPMLLSGKALTLTWVA